jgi:hypothetical protein
MELTRWHCRHELPHREHTPSRAAAFKSQVRAMRNRAVTGDTGASTTRKKGW